MQVGNPNVLVNDLSTLLERACECLEQTPLGAPNDCYLYHNEAPDDCCDILTLSINEIAYSYGPAQGEPGGFVENICGGLSSYAKVTLRLVRSCWPVVKDNAKAPFPSAQEMNNATVKLNVDAFVLRCCVESAIEEGLFGDCSDVFVGDMTPVGPQGGCAGWEWQLMFEIDGCCVLEGCCD